LARRPPGGCPPAVPRLNLPSPRTPPLRACLPGRTRAWPTRPRERSPLSPPPLSLHAVTQPAASALLLAVCFRFRFPPLSPSFLRVSPPPAFLSGTLKPPPGQA